MMTQYQKIWANSERMQLQARCKYVWLIKKSLKHWKYHSWGIKNVIKLRRIRRMQKHNNFILLRIYLVRLKIALES